MVSRPPAILSRIRMGTNLVNRLLQLRKSVSHLFSLRQPFNSVWVGALRGGLRQPTSKGGMSFPKVVQLYVGCRSSLGQPN